MLEVINKFIVVFSSIILEALPFILIGAVLSSIMQVFFTEDLIHKFIPKNKLLSSIGAGFLGLIFPTCECATVPITRGLMRKRVPVNVGITYMLAAPIVNPLVIMSTYYAFNGDIKMVGLRVVLGFIIAVLTGLIMLALCDEKDVLKDGGVDISRGCPCGCEVIATNDSKFVQVLKHSSIEFYEIGKYFIIGSVLAAIFQIAVPKDALNGISQNPIIGILILMAFSFLISLCSEADAFVASTFVNRFSTGAITGFLLIGPMIDLKNAIMLFSAFKKGFVIKLLFVVFSLTFAASCLIF